MIYIYAMRIQNGDQHGTAELLLNRSLEQCTDVQTPARYHRNEHGKPYLTETPEIYVNWSHSRDYVICAISDQEVGIDLQKMDREPKENLIRKALTEEEQEFYRSVPKPERQKLFYQYWSVKESFLKALGTGFYTSLHTFQVDMEKEQPRISHHINRKNYSCRLLTFREPDYVAAVCVENATLEEEDIKITYF